MQKFLLLGFKQEIEKRAFAVPLLRAAGSALKRTSLGTKITGLFGIQALKQGADKTTQSLTPGSFVR